MLSLYSVAEKLATGKSDTEMRIITKVQLIVPDVNNQLIFRDLTPFARGTEVNRERLVALAYCVIKNLNMECLKFVSIVKGKSCRHASVVHSSCEKREGGYRISI